MKTSPLRFLALMTLLIILSFLIYLRLNMAQASEVRHKSQGGRVEIIYLDEEQIPTLLISESGTVISFPAKPSKVLFGRSGVFASEYIDSDLALTPLTMGGETHLFVYLVGRRFSLNLKSSANAPSLIKVRDVHELEYRGPLK